MLCFPFRNLNQKPRNLLTFEPPDDRRRRDRVDRGVTVAVACRRKLRAAAKNVAGRSIERAVASRADEVAADDLARRADRQRSLRGALRFRSLRGSRIVVRAEQAAK